MTPQIFIQTSLHMIATSPFISIIVFTFMSFNLIPAYPTGTDTFSDSLEMV